VGRRGGLVRLTLFFIGWLVLAAMSIAAHSQAYFVFDPTISRAVQSYQSGWLNAATDGLSWIGFPPQSDVLFGLIAVVLFVVGARWAAVMQVVAGVGSGGLYLLLEQTVAQPRPSAGLVRVAGPIQLFGFPSGHLATLTAVCGFLALLGYRRLHPSRAKWVPVVFVGIFVVLMSFARVYSGQHWASDALAGVLLGVLWLAVTRQLYLWGPPRWIEAFLNWRLPESGSVPTRVPKQSYR
jgi:membrane-associated phospholipid phosphatase